MPFQQTNSVASRHTDRRTFHRSTAWKVTRTDRTVFRWTDHDTTLRLADGFDYTPAGAPQSSAHEAEAGLREANGTLSGAISASAITAEELRAGAWDDATVDEYVVDSRYPDIGHSSHRRRWIAAVTEHTAEAFEAEAVGLATKLRQRRGDEFNRDCEHDLGDAFGQTGVSGCKYDLGSNSAFNLSVGSVSSNFTRRVFVLNDNSATVADGEANFGSVKCVVGANVGLEFEVRSQTFVSNQHTVELETETPFDIAVNDMFHLRTGCDGTETRCELLLQFDNFGGFPHMPGTGKTLETPR